MKYGIVDASQLIDVESIQTYCERLKQIVHDFGVSGESVLKAGSVCTEEALSFDSETLEYSINDIGSEIKKRETVFIEYLDQIVQVAKGIYNQQLVELEEYLEKKKEQENQNG